MLPLGQALYLQTPPDLYLVGEELHQVDRVAGRVVSHNIYPIEVLAQTARQGRAIGGAIDRAMAVAFPEAEAAPAAIGKPAGVECAHWSTCSRFERSGSCD